MNKLITLILVLICALSLAACNDNTINIALPFDVDHVESVEIYRYDGNPDFIEKKVVISEDDVKTLHNMFEHLSLEPPKAEKPKGGMITSFRFNLADGSRYELIYCCYGVKNGTLKSSTGNFEYFTIADIGSFWNIIELEAIPAEESELPK